MYLNKTTSNFIKELENTDGQPLYKMEPEEARQFLSEIQKEFHFNISADVKDEIISSNFGDVGIRIIRPAETEAEILPAIIYAHGGGWVLGDENTHDVLIRKLADCTHSAVIFVNYTRSPEAQFPKELNEIYGVLEHICSNSEKYNINPNKIAAAGDSAGANMAAAICIKSKKENGPKVILQILLYPVADARMNSNSYKEYKDGPWLTKKAMEMFWNAYEPDIKNREENIYISLNRANEQDLKNLPPAIVVTAENDVLRDEGEEYARKLDKAGVEVVSVRINNVCHDFMMLNPLANCIEVDSCLKFIGGIVKNKFFT